MRPKIATCCYCGTRAALVLCGRERHELSCAACGAPLHALKSMPMDDRTGGGASAAAAPARRPRPAKPVTGQRPARSMPSSRGHQPPRKKYRKRRKPLGRKLFEELWDVVEDIFD